MKQSANRKGKKLLLGGVLGSLLIAGAACGIQEPKQEAPGAKKEVLIADSKESNDSKEEAESVRMKEIPVQIDYGKQTPEEILASYTEEGMGRFKLNYPDTYTMEYALKTIGKEMPVFSGTDINGRKVDSKSYKGKKYVVNISKSTCDVCEEISPVVQKLEKDNIPVISFYPIDETDGVKAHREKTKWSKDAVALVGDKNPSVKTLAVDTLTVATVPTLLFVDESGKISYVNIGLTDDILMEDMKTKAFGNEKLYDFVRTEVVKVDKDGNIVKDAETKVDTKTPQPESKKK